MHRTLRITRATLATIALVGSMASQAGTLLLPVATAAPPFNTSVDCRGLQVRDADTAVILRWFPALRCVHAVASAGPRQAVIVSGSEYYGTGADDAIRLVDLDSGAVVAAAPLPHAPEFRVDWLRAVDGSTFLISLVHYLGNSTFDTRLVRLALVGGALRIEADVTVSGEVRATDRGDVLTVRRRYASGDAIELLRVADLAPPPSRDSIRPPASPTSGPRFAATGSRWWPGTAARGSCVSSTQPTGPRSAACPGRWTFRAPRPTTTAIASSPRD